MYAVQNPRTSCQKIVKEEDWNPLDSRTFRNSPYELAGS